MKITLISLPEKRFRFTSLGALPPLGLAYIAAELLKKGHQISIIDIPAANLSLDKFRLIIRNDKSDIYGISSTLFGFQDVIKVSVILKEEDPKAFIVLGGLCSVISPELILQKIPYLDVVVQGEGERPMCELCDFLLKKKKLRDIKGIAFRENEEIFYNPQNEYLDLDQLSFPAYNLLNIKHYHIHPPFGLYPPAISMETNRGCAFNCEFCGLSKSYRARNIESVVDEISYLKKTYGINEIYFVDHTFTISEERIQNLCRMIMNRRIKIHWTCKTRVDCVSQETLKAMKKSGCYMISYGVESGSDKILRNLNKGITVEDIKRTIFLSKKYGIRSIAYMIVGSPGEDRNTIQESIRLIQKIKPDYVLYNVLVPAPVSTLYDKAIIKNDSLESFYKDVIFFDANAQWPLYETPEFTKNDIKYWTKKATRDFYFNFLYIITYLMKIRTLRELRIILKGIAMLVLDIFFKERKNVINY